MTKSLSRSGRLAPRVKKWPNRHRKICSASGSSVIDGGAANALTIVRVPRPIAVPPDRYDNIRLFIEYLDPAKLHFRKNNPLIHPPKQIEKIVRSFQAFGVIDPVIVSAELKIIAGEARVHAALRMGLTEIPTIQVNHLTDAQCRALALALNRIPEDAHWDERQLAIELKELSLNNEIELESLGFETGQLDFRIGGDLHDEQNRHPEVDRSNPAVTRPGDRFGFGPHRLLCGNALHQSSYDTLLEGHKAQLVFADPPYNVKINGHASGLGKTQHREFLQASGEMTSHQFVEFLSQFGAQMKRASKDGAILFICMDWRHTYELQSAFEPIFGHLLNLCVWVKNNGGMGSLWRSQHEFVLVFKNGRAPHVNNVQLGKFGRCRTNVWNYAGASSFGNGRDEALAIHPTVKPTALVADAIMDCSNRNGIILDPFAGSGTTLIAAAKTGRRGYGIEIDPHYVDATVTRFRDTFGVEAIHLESGLPFSQLAKARGRKSRRPA
jgi:DNA modification methylase